ncbi:MAG TPA: UbiA family prenyltransferase [Halococcus sp.]|nr:UbiA family prenyltransferase [Halococcus sp.]
MGLRRVALSQSRFREKTAAYAALVRVPNLFSAPPDVLLGAALASATGVAVSIPALVGLSVASILLYAGGTVLNDYFDAAIDATERPERPIPSGRVSRSRAGVLGASLLVVGCVLALATAGVGAGVLATALAVVVALYDGVLKGTPLGFLAMGSARGLDVLLGTTVVDSFDFPFWAVVVSVVVALYIALITYMAANEATDTERRAVVAGIVGVVIAALAVLAAVVVVRPSLVQSALAVALVGGFLVWTGRALWPAYANPLPETVGPAVGACVLALVVLDAAFAAVFGVEWALAILAFLVPALSFSRLFDIS